MIPVTLAAAPLIGLGLFAVLSLLGAGGTYLGIRDQKKAREFTARQDFQQLLAGNRALLTAERETRLQQGTDRLEDAVASVAQDAPELSTLLQGKRQRLAQISASGPRSLAEIIAGV